MKSCFANPDDLLESPAQLRMTRHHHPKPPLVRSTSATDCGGIYETPDATPTPTPPRLSRDWNEALRDLVIGLEKICGADPRSSYPTTPAPTPPPTPPHTSPHHPKRPLSVSLSDGLCRYHGNGHRSRCHDDRRCPRAIFVRHIETHQELDNQLFRICRHGSLTEVNRRRVSGDRWRSLAVAGDTIAEFGAAEEKEEEEEEEEENAKQERGGEGAEEEGEGEREREEEISLKEQEQRSFQNQNALRDDDDPADLQPRFRLDPDLNDLCGADLDLSLDLTDEDSCLRIDVGQREPETLVVALSNRRHLTVETVSTSGPTSVLYDSILSPKLTSGPLLCYLYGNGLLCVARQPLAKAREEFFGTGSTYIPVIRRNESSLELTVVLHIPDNFKFDDIIVKTVDDSLVVTGSKRSPMSFPAEVGVGPAAPGLVAVLPSFRVFVELPRGVDTRSVCASLTGEHQLVVKGHLDSSPRRNTL